MEEQILRDILPTTAEVNTKNELLIGGCNTIKLVEKYGTPLYVIDEKTFKDKCFEYINSLQKFYQDSLVIYASKAFSCTAITSMLNSWGIGIDVVSGGELYTALKSNFNKENIFFHGNNKSSEEIEYAIKESIGYFICDNFYELGLLEKIAEKLNKKVKILARLTPGIECHTHDYIKTGHLDSKFGFDLEYFDDLLSTIVKSKHLILVGLHAHIGSQIFEIKPYTDVVDILMEKFAYAKEKFKLELNMLNIGGGLGISYTNNDDPFITEIWAKTVSETIENNCRKYNLTKPKLICEPGRSLIGRAGITLYTVGNIKTVPGIRKFVAVDGGMADNPRPITYQAKYSALVANKANTTDETEVVTIAGRYCETGDILIKDIKLPMIESGDIIAVSATGAYNYSMSSNYNMVPRAACVLVNNEIDELIIKREEYSNLTAMHLIPSRYKN